MPLGLAFWIIMLLWFVFRLSSAWPGYAPPPYFGLAGGFLEFVLFFLLGWHVFGAALHG